MCVHGERRRGSRTAVAKGVAAVLPLPELKIQNCVWLKALNASARNSILAASLILNCFSRERSKLVRCGLLRRLRPALPKVNPRGAAKAQGL